VSPPYAELIAHRPEQGGDCLAIRARRGQPGDQNHPLLKGVSLPDRLGSSQNLGGPMVTAGGLVFIGGGDGYLYAFDVRTGRSCGAARSRSTTPPTR
jgi:glucose dehydrogenase